MQGRLLEMMDNNIILQTDPVGPSVTTLVALMCRFCCSIGGSYVILAGVVPVVAEARHLQRHRRRR